MTSEGDHVELEFALTEESLGGSVPVLAVAGEIDMVTAPEVDAGLRRLHAAGSRRIMVDLATTDFIDSTGIGVLAEWYERLHADDGAIAVVGLASHIRKIFTVTKLDGPMLLSRTRDEALERLGAPGAAADGA